MSFTKLFHISDIHIRQVQRHQEYREVFGNLYRLLRERVDDKSLLVCTGDILHSKTQLTPECIDLTKEFFTELSNIVPTVVIAGNHDANLSNLSRLDALTPILDGVDVTYLKNSGVYQMRNLSFGVISVFDETFPDMKLHPANKLKIALYHGTLNGAKTDMDYNLSSSITEAQFAGYDLTLLGDIHRHQFLTPRMEYSGSLIQQNFGEQLSNHGMVVWDLTDMTSEFVEVPNKFGYATYYLVDNVLSRSDEQLPEKCSVRLLYQNSNPERVTQACAELESEFGGHVVVARKIRDHRQQIDNRDLSDMIENNQRIDFEALMKVVLDKNAIDDGIIDKVLVKHRELFQMKQIEQSNSWRLVDLSFDNLFCYGIGNQIDFTECRQIMGLLAPNHTGKSALIDILLYALFDKCSRGRTVSDYLNRSCNKFRCRVTFAIGEQLYCIEKLGQVKASKVAKDSLYRKVEVKISFSMHKNQSWVSLNEPSTVQTKGKITELLGDYNDFLLTSIALQDKGLGMLTMTQSERKTLISKLFRLDIFDELHKTIKKKHNLNKGSLEELKRLSSKETSADLQALHDNLNEQYQQHDMERCILDAQVDSFPQQLIQMHNRLVKLPDTSGDLAYTNSESMAEEKASLEERLRYLNETLKGKRTASHVEQQIQKISSKLVALAGVLPNVGAKLDIKQKDLKQVKALHSKNNKELKQSQQLVKKLTKQKDKLSIDHRKYVEHNQIVEQIENKQRVLDKLTTIRISNGCDSCKANAATFAPEQLAIEKQLAVLRKQQKNFKLAAGSSREEIEKDFADITKQWDRAVVELEQLDHLRNELPTQIEVLAREIGELKQQNKDFVLQTKQIKNNEKHQEKINELKEHLHMFEEAARIKDQLTVIRNQGDDIVQNQQTQREIEQIENDYQLAKDKLAAATQKTTDIRHKISLVKCDIKKQKDIEERIAALRQENLVLTAIEKCYHVNGIPCILMEQYIPRVQAEVNKILDRIAPFLVEICVYNQTIELYKVPNNGNPKVHLECTSGFEKFVASLALRIAFRNFSLIAQPNFMILDEGFSSADATNVVGFGPLFNYLREQFQFVIMVSHISELKQESDNTLSLEVIGTKSKIIYPNGGGGRNE